MAMIFQFIAMVSVRNVNNMIWNKTDLRGTIMCHILSLVKGNLWKMSSTCPLKIAAVVLQKNLNE